MSAEREPGEGGMYLLRVIFLYLELLSASPPPPVTPECGTFHGTPLTEASARDKFILNFPYQI